MPSLPALSYIHYLKKRPQLLEGKDSVLVSDRRSKVDVRNDALAEWRYLPIILALRRWRWAIQIKGRLVYLVSPCIALGG